MKLKVPGPPMARKPPDNDTAPYSATDAIVQQFVALLKPIVIGWVGEALDAQKPRPRWAGGDVACAHLGCSPPTLKKLGDQGMPHILVGDHRRYDLAACDAWLLERSGAKKAVP